MTDTFEPNLADVTDLHRAADQCREKITPDQARLVHLVMGTCRGSVSAACRELGIDPRTGWKWRDLPDVKAYAQALMRIEAGKLMISRTTVVGELAAIGMSDISEVVGAVSDAATEVATDALAREAVGLEAEDGDAHQRAILASRTSFNGSEVLRRLPRRISRTIRKVKMETVYRDIYRYDMDAGKSVLSSREPVSVIGEVEMHDKMKPLALLAEFLGLEPGSLSEDGKTNAEAWHGLKIVGPTKAGD